jgi:hypothetical protein
MTFAAAGMSGFLLRQPNLQKRPHPALRALLALFFGDRVRLELRRR